MKIFAALGAAFIVYLLVMAMALGSLMGGSASGSVAGGSFLPGADVGLNPAQLAQAARALTVADHINAPPLPVLAMVDAGLGESGFSDVPNGQGSGYCGVFQGSPSNIACSDTELQARSFLQGGLGFNAGGAIAYAQTHPGASPGLIATLVETSGKPSSFYDVHTPQATRIIAAWRQGTSLATPAVAAGMTPKQIIDQIVLPMARANGIARTVAENDAANAAHGPTQSGGRSDHQGPPDVAWATDMSNGWVTPQEDALAAALAQRFGIPWSGSGLMSATHDGYRFQLIYRTFEGGDHFNHVHFGCRRAG